MKIRMMSCAWLVVAALLTGPAVGQWVPSAEASQCGASQHNAVRVSLSDLGLGAGEHEMTFRVVHAEQELLAEHYRVRIETNQGSTVLPVWLAGATEQELRTQATNGLDARVELISNGKTLASWTLAEFLMQDREAAAGDAEALILERSVADVGDAVASITDEIVSLHQKGTIICPGAFPQCDIEYDLCEAECYLDEQCYQRCSDEFDECAYGITSQFTQRTETARRYGGRTCGFYPWHQVLNPKKWDFWDLVYSVREYERVYCPRTGHTYDTLIRQYNTSETCYRETWRSCNNGPYLGGECRW